MKNVKIKKRGTEKSGTWCFKLELENGTEFVIDNCSRIPEVYLGNVEVKTESGEVEKRAVYLFVNENGKSGVIL